MRAIITLLILAVLSISCTRKLVQQDTSTEQKIEKDSTVERLKMIDVPISIPEDSSALSFSIVAVKDSSTGQIKFKPMTFSTQNGRSKATTTIDEMGNIFTQAHCQGLEKKLQIATIERDRWIIKYHNLEKLKKEVTIYKTPFWAYVALVVSILSTALAIYSR